MLVCTHDARIYARCSYVRKMLVYIQDAQYIRKMLVYAQDARIYARRSYARIYAKMLIYTQDARI